MFIDMCCEEQAYPPEVTCNYTISKRLGSGACGEVKLAFKNDTHEKLAVKIIEKKTFNMANKSTVRAASAVQNDGRAVLQGIESEVRILRQLNHVRHTPYPCLS